LGNRKNVSVGMIVGVVLLVLVAAAVVVIQRTNVFEGVAQLAWLKSGSKSPGTQEEMPTQAQAEQAEQTEPAEPADQTELPPDVQDGSDKNKQPDPVVAKTGGVESAAAVPAPKPAAPASATTVTAQSSAPVRDGTVSEVKTAANSSSPVADNLTVSKSKDLLRLNFREDSWVEIRRADKTTVISRLLKAGTTEAFDITEPVTLVIGNAAGVDASLRGAKLDLEADSSSNVARLNLK